MAMPALCQQHAGGVASRQLDPAPFVLMLPPPGRPLRLGTGGQVFTQAARRRLAAFVARRQVLLDDALRFLGLSQIAARELHDVATALVGQTPELAPLNQAADACQVHPPRVVLLMKAGVGCAGQGRPVWVGADPWRLGQHGHRCWLGAGDFCQECAPEVVYLLRRPVIPLPQLGLNVGWYHPRFGSTHRCVVRDGALRETEARGQFCTLVVGERSHAAESMPRQGTRADQGESRRRLTGDRDATGVAVYRNQTALVACLL